MRRLTINGNNGHQRTPSENKVKEVMGVKNGEVIANTANANNTPRRASASLVGAVSAMSLEENGVEASSSISTFRIVEQEPNVAAATST